MGERDQAFRALLTTIAQATSMQEVTRQVLAITLEAIDLDAGFIAVHDQEHNILRIIAHQELPDELITRLDYQPVSLDTQGVASRAAYQHRTILIEDLAESPLTHHIADQARREKLKSLLSTPLIAKETEVGVLEVFAREGQAITPAQIDFLKTWIPQIALGIHHIRLWEEAQHQVKRLRAINAISQRIAAQSSPSEILQEIPQALYEQLQYDQITLYLREGDYLHLRACAGLGCSLTSPTRYPIDKRSLVGWIAQTGEPLLIFDGTDSPHAFSDLREHPHAQSILAVPIRTREQSVLGVLVAESQRPYAFGQTDLLTLSNIADQVAIGLEKSNLLEQSQRTLQDHNHLVQALHAINRHLDPRRTAEEIVEQACALLNADRGAYFTLADGMPVLQHRLNLSETYLRAAERFLTELPWRLAVKQRRPILIEDVENDPRLISLREEALREGFRTFAIWPFLYQNEVVGFLSLYRDRPIPFSSHEIALGNTFAQQAAIAIENARLYAEERKRAAQMAAVTEVARRINSALSLSEVLQSAVDDIRQRFNYHNVSVFLLDPEREMLKRAALSGAYEGLGPPEYEQPVGVGMVGWVAANGTSLLSNDVRRQPQYIRGYVTTGVTRSELSVPIKLGMQVIGVLDIQSTKLNAFDESDRIAMETVADQLAIAIHNAQAYEQTDKALRRRANELEMVHTIVTSLTHSLDIETVLSEATNQIIRATGGDIGGIILIDEAALSLKILLAENTPQSAIDAVHQMEAAQVQRFLSTLQSPTTISLHQVPPIPPARILLDQGFSSIGIIPLVARGYPLGLLAIAYRQEREFLPEENRILGIVGRQIGVALENALLYSQTDEALQKRVRELALLNLLARTVGYIGNVNAVLPQALRIVVELTNATCGVLDLIEINYPQIQTKAFVTNIPNIQIEHTPPRPPEAPLETVITTRKPLTLENNDLSTLLWPIPPHELGVQRIYLHPLISQQQILGVIHLGGDANFSPESQNELITTAAHQITLAIENHRLYQMSVEKAEELAQAYEELHNTQEQLIRSERMAALGQLSITLRHEINNPLTSILGLSQYLLHYISDLPDEIRKDISVIEHSAQQIYQILKRLEDVRDRKTRYIGQTEMIDLWDEQK